MKHLSSVNDDNPVVSIFILLSIVLLFSFLGTWLDTGSTGSKRSSKGAVEN